MRPGPVAVGIAAAIFALPAAAQPREGGIAGAWQTPVDAGVIEIAPCGPALCGTLVTSAALRAHPDMRNARDRDVRRRGLLLRGLPILLGLRRAGDRWNGDIYNPDDGRTYDARVRLEAPDRLNVSGCALVIFCRSQTWRRIS